VRTYAASGGGVIEPRARAHERRPIRVLDLRDTTEIGGPGKTIIETFNAIDASRFELHLAVFATRHEEGDTPFVRAARQAGMPVHLLRGYNQYDPLLVWRILELVRRLEIDIIHAHEVKSDVLSWLAARLRHAPIMTTLHGWIGNSPKQRLLNSLDRRVVRAFARVVVVSQQMWDQVQGDGYRPGQLCLLHNAIVIEKYRRSGQPGLLAARFAPSASRPLLSCVGRLSAEKGQADLIDALAIVRRQGVQASLMLAGDGPARESLMARAQALGVSDAVFFLGHVDRPQEVLEASDLSVLPSHTEGLPNAALEALVMEVPLLATRVGGTPEVVVDGESGTLVEPHSPEQLAGGILDFASNRPRWQQQAACGRDRVERQFSFDVRTRKLETIYEAMVEERRQ
jgi:glycosyltransferase involved in cell wall biosynthesis